LKLTSRTSKAGQRVESAREVESVAYRMASPEGLGAFAAESTREALARLRSTMTPDPRSRVRVTVKVEFIEPKERTEPLPFGEGAKP
jgi:hypothetical protein